MNSVYERHIRLHALLRGVLSEYDVLESTARADPGKAANRDGDAAGERTRQMLEQNETVLLNVWDTLQELEDRRKRSMREMHELAVELSVMVASHVIQRDLSEDSHLMNLLVQAAIQRLDTRQLITIRLQPDDLEQLNIMWQSMKLERPDNVEFVADGSLSRGSCLADAPDFGLMSSLDGRLDEIRQALLEGIDDAQIERRRIGEEGKSMRRFPDRRETA